MREEERACGDGCTKKGRVKTDMETQRKEEDRRRSRKEERVDRQGQLERKRKWVSNHFMVSKITLTLEE